MVGAPAFRMLVATWNVNSIRARMGGLLSWLEERSPDVVCLQETKVADLVFPREPIEELGYRIECFGEKSYNGVAILSKKPIEDVIHGLPGDDEVAGRRVLAATVEDLMIVCVYVVNGVRVGHERYDYKLRWLGRLAEFVADYDMGERVVIAGDFNVTFDDRDVYDPQRWRERILCSTPERAALARVMEPGLSDAFRKFHEEGGHYTWWDFRTRGWQRGQGLRIDHFLVSPPALDACTRVEVDLEPRAGPRPSDHAPVLATFA